MDTHLREEITRLHAQVCSGLAYTNRILILYTLSKKSLNVGELSDHLGIPQPTTSRHLKILRERGMVVSERDAQSVYYRLADQRVIEALDLLRSVLNDQLEAQAQLLRTSTEA